MLKTSADLQKHVLATYLSLRIGVAIVAAMLPLLLWGGEALLSGDLALKGSMSDYYHSRVGDVFVGVLFVIGAVLYLYKGFSNEENVALNLAGAFVICVALLPTEISVAMQDHFQRCACAMRVFTAEVAHKGFAVLFFLCIAYVAIWRAPDTLELINDPKRADRYRRIYKYLGIAMAVGPIAAALILYAWQFDLDKTERTVTFIVEAIAVWIFAAYWAIKSRELAETDADSAAISQRMPPPQRKHKNESGPTGNPPAGT